MQAHTHLFNYKIFNYNYINHQSKLPYHLFNNIGENAFVIGLFDSIMHFVFLSK